MIVRGMSGLDLQKELKSRGYKIPIIERGCWWLPALRLGQMCFGSAAYRGKDFVILLD